MKNIKINIIFTILVLYNTSCSNTVRQNNVQEKSQDSNIQNIVDRINTDIAAEYSHLKLLKLDTIPSGSFCFIDDVFIGITPLYIEINTKNNTIGFDFSRFELQDHTIRFERLRYYSENIEIEMNQIIEGNDIIIILKNENKTFIEDTYLSYSSRLQGDGIQKEFCRFVYDDNAQLIRIDSYIHNEKQRHYNTTDNQFQMLLPVSDKDIDRSEYIIEIEYGSKESEHTMIITEKYLYFGLTNEEKEENLKNDYLPRTIYTYQ